MVEPQLVNEKTSSINLSCTSKGAYSWDIKLYFNEDIIGYNGSDKITTSDGIIKELKRLDALMKINFKGQGE